MDMYHDHRGRLCYDPDGRFYGLPVYPWRGAPDGLATRRQLAALGLRPGGQPVVAQIWRLRKRRGPLIAYLYRVDKAKPKREATPAIMAAVQAAVAARRVCPECKQDRGYVLPKHTGYECNDCYERRVA